MSSPETDAVMLASGGFIDWWPSVCVETLWPPVQPAAAIWSAAVRLAATQILLFLELINLVNSSATDLDSAVQEA
jgi:hypothetical protein